MKTLQEIATNLMIDENTETANHFYKLQFLQGKYIETKNRMYITVAENKELRSLDLEDTFGMLGEDVIGKNNKRFSEILKSAITLEEAYNKSI